LKRGPVLIAHQETDQTLVGVIHLVLAPREADTRGIHHGEVGRHGVVKTDETVVEYSDGVLGCHSVGRGHSGNQFSHRPGGHRSALGIELDASLEPLAPSRALVVRSGAYVIRDAQMSVESIQWEYDLLGFLAPRVPAVIAPLRAVDGSTFLAAGDRVVSVMPYVAAERAERTDPRVR